MTIARKYLLTQARMYLESCEIDLKAAEARKETARRIVSYLSNENAIVGMCPTPILDETSARAQRFAARVDGLLTVCFDEESGDNPEYLANCET